MAIRGTGMMMEDQRDEAMRFMLRRIERVQEMQERGLDIIPLRIEECLDLLQLNLSLHVRCNRLEDHLADIAKYSSQTSQRIVANDALKSGS
jgi:hypothetical protein